MAALPIGDRCRLHYDLTIVTRGEQPGWRATVMRLARSRSRSARDLALRSTPSTSTSPFDRRTVFDLTASWRRQSLIPTASAFPGNFAATSIQDHGTGPLRN